MGYRRGKHTDCYAGESMIYHCPQCATAQLPGAELCPGCGFVFETPIPESAESSQDAYLAARTARGVSAAATLAKESPAAPEVKPAETAPPGPDILARPSV